MMAPDLSRLPAPQVVETLRFETVFDAMLRDFQARCPQYSALLASDPAIKLIEVAAYRELLLRARINEAARAIMLPWAQGSDLDNIAARYGVERMAGEDDDRLRARVLIAYHQLAGAGSPAGWRYHALSANAAVIDADVWSPRPGAVTVSVLARAEAHERDCTLEQQAVGRALFGAHPRADMRYIVAADVHSGPLLDVVQRLTRDDVLPLTVDLRVTPVQIIPYAVTAHVISPPGNDAPLIAQEARDRLVREARSRAAFRVDVHRAALIGALMDVRVRDVHLSAPGDDIAVGPGQIAVMTEAVITAEVAYD